MLNQGGQTQKKACAVWPIYTEKVTLRDRKQLPLRGGGNRLSRGEELSEVMEMLCFMTVV